MKLKVTIGVVVLILAGLLGNAVVVGRAERAAEPFGGGHVLALPGPDLNVREYGSASSDEAVVLLHGYSASIEWWQPVAEKLAAAGRRVIAIDLVGHGGSEAPDQADAYWAPGQASAVREALTALGVRHAVLVGHSMGGDVAAALAQQNPDLVDRVVVSDTPAADDLVRMPLLGQMACWPVLGPALDRFRGIDAITKSSLQTGFDAGYPVPEFAYRSLKRLTYHGLCDSKGGGERQVGETLAGLGKPVLVLWGSSDVLTPTKPNVERYTELGLAPRIIAGSGHSPMVEKPDEFLTAVGDFVSRIGPGR